MGALLLNCFLTVIIRFEEKGILKLNCSMFNWMHCPPSPPTPHGGCAHEPHLLGSLTGPVDRIRPSRRSRSHPSSGHTRTLGSPWSRWSGRWGPQGQNLQWQPGRPPPKMKPPPRAGSQRRSRLTSSRNRSENSWNAFAWSFVGPKHLSGITKSFIQTQWCPEGETTWFSRKCCLFHSAHFIDLVQRSDLRASVFTLWANIRAPRDEGLN